MKMRILVKSHENGSNEQVYFCTNPDDFNTPADEFFLLGENESVDIDETVSNIAELEMLPLPFDRALEPI